MLKLKNNSSKKRRNKPCKISLAEIITILVLFHQIRYREFKAFYYGYVCQWLKNAFPRLPSYNRMVELMEKAVYPMCDYLQFLMQGNCTGISYIDSTSLAVCDNHRIKRNKVFADTAGRGKSSMGWFFGFKGGICQHSCHPYLNQATKTSVGITRLDGRTGLRAVG